MASVRFPQLHVEPVAGHPGQLLLRVEYEFVCEADDPIIGAELVEAARIRAVDEQDAATRPTTDSVVELTGRFLAAAGVERRWLEEVVPRIKLDVQQDWWASGSGGETEPIAEWVDHVAATITVVEAEGAANAEPIAVATTPVVSGSWGPLGPGALESRRDGHEVASMPAVRSGRLRPVHILGLHIAPATGQTVVLLGEVNEITHVLPIFIGPQEAQSIAAGFAERQGERPSQRFGHDLTAAVLRAGNMEMIDVAITGLIDGVFVAEVGLETPTGSVRVPSRPSDGLALAARTGAPILLDAGVFAAAAVELEHEVEAAFTEAEIDSVVEHFREFLDQVEPGDFSPPGVDSGPEDEGADDEG